MVRPKKNINAGVDTKVLAIQAQKEEEPISEEQSIVDKLYIPIVNDKSIKNLTINHALLILNQQMKLNGLRKRTIDDYIYQFKRFDKIYEYLSLLGNI